MVEPEATPLDLAYDQLLRTLSDMETQTTSAELGKANAISEIIESILVLTGSHRGFSAGIELALQGRLSTKVVITPALLYEALSLSEPMSEAMVYVQKNLADAPTEGDVRRARQIMSKARLVVWKYMQNSRQVAAHA